MRARLIDRSLGWLCLGLFVVLVGCSRTEKAAPTSSDNPLGASDETPVEVTAVEMGRGVDADKRVTDRTEVFQPKDMIHASVITNGAASDAEIKTRWIYEDGTVVHEAIEHISPTGYAATEFHVGKPDGFPPGQYKVEVYLNGVLIRSQPFEVKAS